MNKKEEKPPLSLKKLSLYIIVLGIFFFIEVSSIKMFGDRTSDKHGKDSYGNIDYDNVIGVERYYSDTPETIMYILGSLLILGGTTAFVIAVRDEEKNRTL
jgi:hypothetical protein